jgi:ADP-ribose pyrophosphatase YjhB (NUDIX family)
MALRSLTLGSGYNTCMSRVYPERPIVGVGAVIVHGGEVLIVRRANPPLQGEWSIPGGALDLGEKLRDGVAREVLEETGLVVEAGPVLDVFDSIFSDSEGRTEYHYVLVDYLCHLRSGTLAAASDASEVRWVRPEELAALGMKPVTIAVIRKAFALEAAEP